MPIYEYECPTCGPFATSAPMAASAWPANCPHCGSRSPRILSVVAVAGSPTGGRRRKRTEPMLVKNERDPPKKTGVVRPHVARPWMIGH